MYCFLLQFSWRPTAKPFNDCLYNCTCVRSKKQCAPRAPYTIRKAWWRGGIAKKFELDILSLSSWYTPLSAVSLTLYPPKNKARVACVCVASCVWVHCTVTVSGSINILPGPYLTRSPALLASLGCRRFSFCQFIEKCTEPRSQRWIDWHLRRNLMFDHLTTILSPLVPIVGEKKSAVNLKLTWIV